MKSNYQRKYYKYSYKDFHGDYKKRQEDPIDLSTYKEVINRLFDISFDKIMTEKFHLTMPLGTGDFFLKEVKPAGYYLYYKTNTENTFGKVFKFCWDHTYTSIKNLKYIKFQKSKAFKIKLRNFYKSIGQGINKTPSTYSYPLKEFHDLG